MGEVKIKSVSKGKYTCLVEWRQGGRKRRYFTSKSQATSFAQSKRLDLARHGTDKRPLSELEWAAIVEARKHKVDLIKAVQAVLEKRVSEETSVPVSQAVEHRLMILTKDAEQSGKKSHLIDQRYRLTKFSTTFGTIPICNVNEFDVQRWLDTLKMSPQSVKNMARALSALWELATRKQWAESNITQRLTLPRVGKAPIGILTPGQLQQLFQVAEPDVIPLIAIAAFAGLRTAETHRLSWEQINLDRGFIEVTADNSKSAARRLVDISDNLKGILSSHSHSGSVKPNSNGYRRAIRSVPFEWPANALRHSFASYHLALHESADKTALQLGHTTTSTLFAHYRELATKEDAAKWFSIIPK